MNELFNGLALKDAELLLASINLKTINLKNGEKLFLEGDICNKLAYITKGEVIAKQSFQDGHDCILKVINKNKFIGINLIFSSNPIYKATFYSQGETTVKIISKDDLLKLMNNKKIESNVLAMLSDYALELNEHIKLLNHKNIRSKICYYLYTKYITYNSLKFKLNITKTNLAALLNVERPSLSFEIKKLCDEKIIKNHNKDYEIIDLNKILKEI